MYEIPAGFKTIQVPMNKAQFVHSSVTIAVHFENSPETKSIV